jgi:A/G-specific adenine glycosylase
MWTDALQGWYQTNGRHSLPWRLTTDPWPVLVSEVMLQQTSVARVLPRWGRFLSRWPDPAACAAATQEDVLREWQGLGYPRRARSLWLTATELAAEGWPADGPGLRKLPGVGLYTARALLAFSDLGIDQARDAPLDVNVSRVAARAGIGDEPQQVARRDIETVLAAGRPPGMRTREYTYALFDVGARHCRAIPMCDGCPLGISCLASDRRHEAGPRPRRQAAYHGSFRQLRGAVLAAALRNPGLAHPALRQQLTGLPIALLERFDDALLSLAQDGLLPGACAGTPAPG